MLRALAKKRAQRARDMRERLRSLGEECWSAAELLVSSASRMRGDPMPSVTRGIGTWTVEVVAR